MSGLALMSAPAANATITAITAVTNNPVRATNTVGAGITANITATTDTTQVNNIVVGETVAIFGVITAAPTPATADSITIAGVGETISGTGYLKSGAASDIRIFGSESNLAFSEFQAGSISRFNTAGVYAATIWIDHQNFGGTGGNGTYNNGEALFNASFTIGGAPTSFALSKTSAEVAGTASTTVGITLKDTAGRATLFSPTGGAAESVTAAATIAALSTETLTVRRGTTMTSNTDDALDIGAPGAGRLLSQHRPTATPPGFFSIGANDSITASTGSYNIALNHTGKTTSTLVFDWGGTLFLQRGTPQTFTLSSLTSGTVSKVELVNTSGVQVDSRTVGASGVGTPEVFTAPVAVDTPTTYVYAVNPSQTTISLKLTGTAGVIVNVTVSGSTVAGVTSAVTPITIGADGTATVSYAATTATGTYTVTIPVTTSDGTVGNSVSTFTYESSVVTGAALGSNGISTDVLSTSVTTVIKKIGDTTAIKVNVKDQYGVAKQFYTVNAALSAASRNFGAIFTAQFTDADGNATITLKDVSTSTTNLTDVLSIGVQAPQVTLTNGGLLTGTADRALTINYSATGLYSTLTLAGGTAATTVTREIESSTGSTLATVSLVPTLRDALGANVAGVALTYTGSEGVYFRTAQATRPTTGDVKTITRGSAVTVFAFGTKPGVATVTVTGGGLTATATFTVSAAVVATARVVSAVADKGRVTATVKDGWGNPVAGITVGFASDSKGIFGNGTSSTSAVTDATGAASALVQSADGTGADTTVISSITGGQTAALADGNVTGFAAGVASATVTAKPAAAGASTTDTAVTAVKADVATANAAVKALATQVTVLQASVATLIDSLTTQIASLMKSVSALTKAVAKLQKK
jgi:hypothetical protein